MIRWILALAVVICLTASATAQSTRPATVPVGWTHAVSDFAAAINSGDTEPAQAILADQVDIHTFASGQSSSLKTLIDFASAQTLVGAHGYLHPPLTMAADLAADVAASDSVPSDAKQSMAEDPKAADIAVKWVSSTLNPDKGTFVGVIALWDLRITGTTDNPAHPSFILVKGLRTDAGKFVITTIVFGDPIPGNAD